uniref:Uncharacterized protein n=1 Tax=Anguilla anguilla TaxID=7936 RepID=A0A0E9WR37_ANGAN
MLLGFSLLCLVEKHFPSSRVSFLSVQEELMYLQLAVHTHFLYQQKKVLLCSV